MALPAYQYARVALNAELHVQVTVDHVQLPPSTPGDAVVTGHIARVFRGSPSLCSTPVSFMVPVCREHDDVTPSGTIWNLPDRLVKARVMEVFLNSHEGGFRNASYDNHVLPALTDTPTTVYTEEMAREPRQPRFPLVGTLSVIALAVFCWALVRCAS